MTYQACPLLVGRHACIKGLISLMLRRHKRKLQVKLIVFLMVVACMFVLVTVFLDDQVRRITDNEINAIMLEQFDQRSKSVENTVNELINYSYLMFEDSTCFEWIHSDEYSVMGDTEMVTILRNFVRMNELIDNVYMINFQTDRVLDSNRYMSLIGDFDDQVMIDHVKTMQSITYRFTRVDGRICMVVGSNASSIHRYGAMVIFVNEDKLIERCLDDGGNNYGIIDENGEVLLGFLDDQCLQVYQSVIANTDYDDAYIVIANSLGIANWQLYYIIYLHDYHINISRINTISITSLIVLMICVLGACGVNLLWLLRPVKKLSGIVSKHVEELPQHNGNTDLYDQLYDQVHSLIDTMQTAKHSAIDARRLLAENRLYQWIIDGHIEHMSQDGSVHSRISHSNYVAVVVVQCNFSIKDNYEQRIHNKIAIGEFITQGFASKGFPIDYADMGGLQIALIIGFDDPCHYMVITEQILQIKQALEDGDYALLIAMSGYISSNANLRKLYDQNCYLVNSAFLCTHMEVDRIIAESKQQLEEHKLKDLMLSIQKIDVLDVEDSLAHLFEALADRTQYECANVCLVLVCMLVKYFDAFVNAQEDFQKMISNIIVSGDVQGAIESEVKDVINKRKEGRKAHQERRDDIVAVMMDFIEKNITNIDLCVATIAADVCLSENYVRKLFKDSVGVSLSSYIVEKRIEISKELLQDQQLSLNEIMVKAGFVSRSVFFNAFKKSTMMTPMQYRTQWVDHNQDTFRPS